MNNYSKRKKFKKLAKLIPLKYQGIMESDKVLNDKIKEFEAARMPTAAEKAHRAGL